MDQLGALQIKQYEIQASLGEGRLGRVYRAHDRQLRRFVALKLFHPHLSRQTHFQRQFHRVISTATRLQHRTLTPIHDFGNEGEQYYLVSDLLAGKSLASHFRQMLRVNKRYDLREVLHVLSLVADGLGVAHRAGLLHQNFKPGNIILQPLQKPELPGEPAVRPYLTDYGIGQLDTRPHTEYPSLLPYLAPEQCLGDIGQDGRSEVYSLGILLFQLVTGQLPFQTRTLHEAIKRHLHGELPPPTGIHPGLPLSISDIIRRATAKRPEQRYQTAEAMAQAMRISLESLTGAERRRYAGTDFLLSLSTPLQTNGHGPQTEKQSPEKQVRTEERLIIASRDAHPRIVPLNQDRYELGRSPRNDILLDHETVSNRHFKMALVDGDWFITDVHSTNGTYLDGERIDSGKAICWSRGRHIRIGKFYLQVHRQGTPLPDNIIPPKELQPEPERPALSSPPPSVPPIGKKHGTTTRLKPLRVEGQVNLVVTPQVIEMPADGRVHCQVGIYNHSNVDDHFQLDLPEVPAGWYSLPQPGQFLAADGKAQLGLLLHLPPEARTNAGTFPLVLQVQGKNHPQLRSRITVQITIPVVTALKLKLVPTGVTHQQKATLYLQNSGNTPAIFNVTGEDPQNKVQFTIPAHHPPLPPGEERAIPITVAAKERAIFGETRVFPFELLVDVGNLQQRRQGECSVPPLLPPWSIPLIGLVLGIVLLTLFLGGLYLLGQLF